LVDLQLDVILSEGSPATAALQRETRTVPIVFAAISDSVGKGFVENLPRPRGNLTGFDFDEPEILSKFVELLSEIAPSVKRVAIIFNPNTMSGGVSYYLSSFEAAARSFKVAPIAEPVLVTPKSKRS
jgi:putative ABC transport system substrate-binding protein